MSSPSYLPDDAAEDFSEDLETWLTRERERRRLWRAYLRGELPPTLSVDERRRMREEFFAKGGKVTRCPEGAAEGSDVGPVWPETPAGVRVEFEEPEE